MRAFFLLLLTLANAPPEFFPHLCAFLCFFDFLSAFPSVAHDYLFRVLEYYGCPLGLRNFIFSVFIDVVAYTAAGGVNAFLFLIQAGVIQGDPMAGFLFVVILDPCLHLLYNTFEKPGHGYVRACADDIGAVLKDI